MSNDKLSELRGQTVESVLQEYSEQVNLKALWLQLIMCSFPIVIIPKTYRDKIAEYLQSADESLEARIAMLYNEKRLWGYWYRYVQYSNNDYCYYIIIYVLFDYLTKFSCAMKTTNYIFYCFKLFIII